MIRAKTIILYLLTAAVALSLCSCATKRKSSLQPRVQSYHQAYKWREYTQAAAYTDRPESFLKKTRQAEQRVEVAEYEILDIRFNAEGNQAIVKVRRTYTVGNSVTVHKQVLKQKWRYDKKKNGWFLVSPY